ncbi:Hypothetical predicted protein [Scomber scombrus]|uniref:Uncharacterized protein n=1 Tax=Scomber scombrus TaxID=13677 RepID=A0AAV1N6U3_SCOSC
MGRELIKVGLSRRRGDSPYSSSTKVQQRQEQGEPLVPIRTSSGTLSSSFPVPHLISSDYNSATAHKLKYESPLTVQQLHQQLFCGYECDVFFSGDMQYYSIMLDDTLVVL